MSESARIAEKLSPDKPFVRRLQLLDCSFDVLLQLAEGRTVLLGDTRHWQPLLLLLMDSCAQPSPEFREPALLDFSFLAARLELNFMFCGEGLSVKGHIVSVSLR